MFSEFSSATSMMWIHIESRWRQALISKVRMSFISAFLILGISLFLGCSNEESIIELNKLDNSPGSSEVAINPYSSSPVRAAYSGETLAPVNLSSNGISVTGASSISTEPDLVLLNLGVETFSTSVKKARSEAAKSMESLMTTLRKKDVKKSDIKTARFNIYPRYEYQESMVNGRPVGKQILTGYVVNNEVLAKVRDLDRVGEIIDSAAEAGGDDIRINSIDFTLDDSSVYMNALREQAVADAFTKASHYADLANVSLGPLMSLSESGVPSIRSAGVMDFGMRAMSMAESSPISSGQLDVVLTVNMVFSVNY